VTAHAAGNGNYLDADGPSQTFPVIYAFTGFLPTVSNTPVVNTDKAGGIIKFKFTLGGDKGLNVLSSGSPVSGDISGSCSTSGAPAITTPTVAAAAFKFDPTTGQYVYSWQTDPQWIGTCRQFALTLADGTVHRANFQFSGTAPAPTVTLSVSPAQVIAGLATTLTFNVSVTAQTAITGVFVPCTTSLVPALQPGATSYTGSCQYATTFSAPPLGSNSYSAPFSATVNVIGQSTATVSNAVVTVLIAPAPTVTLSITTSPSPAVAGLPVTITSTINVTSQTPIRAMTVPCGTTPLQPALPAGATSYTASCTYTTSAFTSAGQFPLTADVYVNGRIPSTAASTTITVVEPPPPTVTLAISPSQAVAGMPASVTFGVSVASPTAIRVITGLPCNPPVPAAGITSYSGSCTYSTTFKSPGSIAYTASAYTVGRANGTNSNAVTLTVVKRNQ